MTSPFVILEGGPKPTPSPNIEVEPPWFRVIPGESPLIYLARGSQVFSVDPALARELSEGDVAATESLRAFAAAVPLAVAPSEALPAWNALSLNIAQSCNLSCDYCYADEGRFRGRSRMMEPSVAIAAVSRFLNSTSADRVTLGFIGGEPFLNRTALHAAVDCAIPIARARSLDVRFSITTNGTLLTDDDVVFLRKHRFAVSVSVDGSENINDAHRRTRQQAGSFGQVGNSIRPLLEDPQECRVAARATITRDNLDVLDRLNHLEAMGFAEAGVSPLRTSPVGGLTLQANDWPVLLAAMCRAGEQERRRVMSGQPLRFSNLRMALTQIHRGHSSPLPCGAGANYLSANAEGKFYTCHRTIDDGRFYLGSLGSGPSEQMRAAFLSERHVDRQEPCRTCWARYLCGGGCHAEVVAAGRASCDYIRGWLEYCLQFYQWALNHAPDLFSESRQ